MFSLAKGDDTLNSSNNIRTGWQVWFDRLLVVGCIVVTAICLLAVGRELCYFAAFPSWTSMWESAPLQVAWDVAEGQTVYGDWNTQPVHLAIYGPLYYQLLGGLGWLIDTDPVGLISLGRWMGVASLLVGLLSIACFVRRSGAPLWSAVISLVCVALLTKTGIRFIASSRPDALAACFSLLALTCAMGRSKSTAILSALLLTAAWQTKTTAVAAPITIVAVHLLSKQWRELKLIILVALVLNGIILACLALATKGWFLSHLLFTAHAPMKLEYIKHMLTYGRSAPAITCLLVLPLTLLLTSLLIPKNDQELRPSYWPTACIFFITSLGIALITAGRQGSDRNYLIEPALAAGMLIGLWSARIRSPGGERNLWTATRGVAAIALFSVSVLCLPDRFKYAGESDRIMAQMNSPYKSEAFSWIRTQPQPLLSLDPWLAYCAGADNDLNDPIAYASFASSQQESDPITKRVTQQYYAAIVTQDPVDRPPHNVYGDIPAIWPALTEAIRSQYTLHEKYLAWHLYYPKQPTTAEQMKNSNNNQGIK